MYACSNNHSPGRQRRRIAPAGHRDEVPLGDPVRDREALPPVSLVRRQEGGVIDVPRKDHAILAHDGQCNCENRVPQLFSRKVEPPERCQLQKPHSRLRPRRPPLGQPLQRCLRLLGQLRFGGAFGQGF